ncbi:fused MFS/spermidine synthase [Zoogloea sp.]|uniref:fused MFS/spermidine synthase n=1 Tax=Zoogloea sp. TaxID=49181 RepID=UPI00262E9A03|nr:fused MFS/spermidine synthase [uncultured Zoogloea sp.]
MNTPIDISEESGVRYLHFGSDWVQGAMRLRKPDALELEYTREMMAGLLLRPAPWPARVLLIGLGAGSLAKFVHRQLPGAATTVVEIAPEVHAVARQYFRLPDEDERLRVVIGDGAAFVEQDDSQWDLIAVDGFDSHARAGALAGQAFYEACRRRLSADGLLAVNMFGELRGFKTQLQRLQKAFGGRVLALPPCPSGNVVAFATAGEVIEVDAALLEARAAALEAGTGLKLGSTLKRLRKSGLLGEGRLRL